VTNYRSASPAEESESLNTVIVKIQLIAEAIKIPMAAIIPHFVNVPPRFCNLT